MFHYMLMPLDQHFDGGLGATGEAFKEAADMLLKASEHKHLINFHLPVNFLYRHAVELFLKSMIVVVHRALKVPYGANVSDGPPFVLSAGKWTALHRVHSVATLWKHFKHLIRENKAVLKTRCHTDWSSYPQELDAAIEAIEKADASSTFFRYPDRRDPASDAAKSSWKQKEADEISAQMASGGKYVKAFLLLGPEGDVSRAFQYDDEPLSDLSKMLRETAYSLSGAHFGLRVELAGGF